MFRAPDPRIWLPRPRRQRPYPPLLGPPALQSVQVVNIQNRPNLGSSSDLLSLCHSRHSPCICERILFKAALPELQMCYTGIRHIWVFHFGPGVIEEAAISDASGAFSAATRISPSASTAAQASSIASWRSRDLQLCSSLTIPAELEGPCGFPTEISESSQHSSLEDCLAHSWVRHLAYLTCCGTLPGMPCQSRARNSTGSCSVVAKICQESLLPQS